MFEACMLQSRVSIHALRWGVEFATQEMYSKFCAATIVKISVPWWIECSSCVGDIADVYLFIIILCMLCV